MRKVRKGFTLVELLIVIAILGALASMMTLSGTNATASANATKIITNLQTMKSAVLMFLNDYTYSEDADFTKLSKDYFDASTMKELRADYGIAIVAKKAATAAAEGTPATPATPKKWYVGYKFKNEADATQIKKILASRAENTALLGGTALGTLTTAPDADEDNPTTFKDTHAVVMVRVR